ncbi:hypothetical protein [Streptomyces sp. NBC_00091]|uniref:hypothetical protein n=1 Tax=Streptomyces sp. NBC_00091 TaxID=2975648 RepID=UPI002251B894|nr:hypothetical protein [Streptomyces sp. NBC_00091]MCX5377955.1 hypothetical protein [Streptomyces sp. NBC_00091]
MHGPGLPPQQGPHGHRPPLSGAAMTLRVLFTALPVLSCGFFAWGAMLRLAILTRKPRDWALLVLSLVLSVVWIVFIEIDPTADTNGWQGNLGAGGSIFTGFAVCVYYLVGDIKHHEAKALAPAPAPWYPAPQAPYGGQPQHQPPHQTSPGYGYPPAGQPAQPPVQPHVPPQQPAPPPRLGQVRAELDELSELLRKQTALRPPQPGGPYQDPNSTAIQDPQQ